MGRIGAMSVWGRMRWQGAYRPESMAPTLTGFTNSFVTGAAKWAYSQTGYDIVPTPGENPDTSIDKYAATYRADTGTGRVPFSFFGSNVFGKNEPIVGNWWEWANIDKQGGLISRIGNAIPIGNAIAVLHDTWMNNVRPENYGYLNYPVMLPAVAMTLAGSINGPLTVQLSNRNR